MKSNFQGALSSQHYTVYKLLLFNVGILGCSAAVRRLHTEPRLPRQYGLGFELSLATPKLHGPWLCHLMQILL